MPVFNSKQLLADLEADVQTCITATAHWAQSSVETLRQPPANGGWSVVEVLDHLNFYGAFYTEAIATAMANSGRAPGGQFNSGWLGNYFTRIIGPAPAGKVLKQKFKAPANAKPLAPRQLDPQEVLQQYQAYQQTLQQLLQQVHHKNLGTIRVPTSLSPLVRLKLGDTFRFVIAHQQRHHQQIQRILTEVAEGQRV